MSGIYEDDPYEEQRMQEQSKRIKDQADENMREYYANNPDKKAKADRIMWITLGGIVTIVGIFIIVYAIYGN